MDKICPRCNAKTCRDGHVNISSTLKQRYFCRSCDYHFTTHHVRQKLQSKKEEYLTLLRTGYSINEISKQLDVHPSTISRWTGDRTEIYQVRILQIRTIQLFMEVFFEDEISGLLSVHRNIIHRWFALFTGKPLNSLPRLDGLTTHNNQVPDIARCFYKKEKYEMVFRFDGEFYRISSKPNNYKDYGKTYKQLRMAQLYLNGADIDILLLALKYERMDKLRRKLKDSPAKIRNQFHNEGSKIVGAPQSYMNGDFMIKTNNGNILLRDESKKDS